MNETLAAIFAVGSAAAWGAGDFSGGLASKRSSPLSVTLVSNPLGLILVIALALVRGAPGPSQHDAILGFSAGMCGAIGLLAFYRALASGKMGVVAPITAVVANVISMLFGAFSEGFPSALQLVGFGLAILGVYVISKPETNVRVSFTDLIPVLTAGVAFGVFFILTGNYSGNDLGWTLVVARLGTISMVVASALWTRHQFKLERQGLPLVFVAGGMDTLGNVLFALATQMGRLDVGSALSSLYPVTTVVLAIIFLRERLSRSQGLGAVIALISIPLIVA